MVTPLGKRKAVVRLREAFGMSERRAFGTRAPMLVPMMPNERWSLDFCRTNSPTAAASAS